MATVGERLRLLRESRNTTIEEMVTATGIGQSYLEALENDEIHELPGKAFGKLYIRAYAEIFGFDPQPWIDDYDREQRRVQGAATEPTSSAPAGSRPVAAAIARWKAERAAVEMTEPVVEDVENDEDVERVEAIAPELDAPPTAPVGASEMSAPANVSVPPSKRRIAPYVLLAVVVIASAIYFGMRRAGDDEGAAPPSAERPVVEPAPESRPPEPPPPVIAKPQTPAPTRAPVVRDTPVGPLTVTEFGVGRRVVNLRLEGESDHFAPGDRVCFSSRVLGGQHGEVIRHVWMHDGRVQQTITLRLGGPDFRTHSNKTLGHSGAWEVEARDDKGGVLARAAFTCEAGLP